MELDLLLARAGEALRCAHAPWSGFRVGAAVLSEQGNVYTGCNVESVAFPVGGCAEHHAIAAGVLAEGAEFRVSRIAVAAHRDGSAAPVPPCGACRQLIAEFGADAEVAFLGRDGAIARFSIATLLPESFSLEPAG